MANSVDPDQTPIGAVCFGSMMFASILISSVMLGDYLLVVGRLIKFIDHWSFSAN